MRFLEIEDMRGDARGNGVYNTLNHPVAAKGRVVTIRGADTDFATSRGA
jgi:hypothetical protein